MIETRCNKSFSYVMALVLLSVLHDPTVSAMEPLHSSGQNDQNEMQHGFFGHVIPLELWFASCDT